MATEGNWDGSRRHYRFKYEGDHCCKSMDAFLDTNASFCDLTTVASRLSGESMDQVRFCPWCGWDHDKVFGITSHRKQFEFYEEADHIGAAMYK